MKALTLLAALFLASPLLAGDYLIRVDAEPVLVADAGLPVLAALDKCCIARATTADLERLAALLDLQVLDQNPADALYIFVMPDAGFDRDCLKDYGRVLTEAGDGVLLRTDDLGVERLNRLPVELCRISMAPAVLRRPAMPRPVPVDDSLVRMLVDRVSQDTLEACLRRLIAFYTRYSTNESCASAAAWLRDRLAAYNCDSTALHRFRSNFAPNVLGIKTGRVNPNRIYLVSGHIDNTSELAPNGHAPGSDDNASGIGTVLEVARVCADVEFDNTVWFVGFSGEEQGLYGSDSLAHECRLRGDSIALAINFDMVSYGRDDSATVVWTSALPETRALALYFLALADTFTELKAKDTLFNTANSDHASFWKYGFLAIRGRYHDRTPKYHTTGDTIGPFHFVNCGTNNLPLFTEVVKATVATVAKLAGARQPVGVNEAARAPAPVFECRPTVGRGRFVVTAPSGAQVGVYDAGGRAVLSLTSGIMSSSLAIDLRSMAPGVYYARCGAGRPVRLTVAR